MAKCKRCNQENLEKKKVFICDVCKEKELECLSCGGRKSKAKYKFCTKCLREDKEYREKLSKSLKGKKSWSKGLTKENHPGLAKISDSKKGKEAWNKGLTSETDIRVLKNSESLKGREPWNKGLTSETDNRVKKSADKRKGYKPSKSTKNLIREKLLKRIESGEIYNQPRSSWYEYKDIKCQGRSELKWVKENYKLIKNSRLNFKTPFGLYIGDFEIKDKLIEIKSLHTFKTMLDKKKQFEKILWVNKNIKPLDFVIDYKNEFHQFSIPTDAGVEWAIKKMDELRKKYKNV